MAFKILEECIICAKCEPLCPTSAISLGEDIYEIEAEKCVECVGFYDEPQCASVCPVDVIIKVNYNVKVNHNASD